MMFQESRIFPRLVLFDLDGTLIEFHKEYLFTQADSIMEAAGLSQISWSVYEECFADFDFFRFVEEVNRDSFCEHFWREFDFGNFPAAMPLPGSVEILKSLAENSVTACIVTARIASQDEMQSLLEPTGFLPYLSSIVTRPGEHVTWTDKTDMILATCEEFAVSPSDALMIGDIPPDVDSAKQVGIGTTVAVRSGGVREHVLEASKPDYVLNSVQDLWNAVFDGTMSD